jgi:tripartite ATP-independent transporter DctM subunit
MAALALVATVLFLAFLFIGLFVGAAQSALAMILGTLFSDRPMWAAIPFVNWNTETSFIALAIPLFLLMGELAQRGRLAEPTYVILSRVLRPLPGGLLHTNIVANALFSAVSGSTAASTAAIGIVALPNLKGYNVKIALGSLAAGGALGNLIPPGINFILYALFTNTSVGALFLAGVIPGILVSLLFMAWIAIAAIARPSITPVHDVVVPLSKLDFVRALALIALIIVVMGSIYGGLATPSEAAAVAVVVALSFGILTRGLDAQGLTSALSATARNTGMMMFIMSSALLLNYSIVNLGIAAFIADSVAQIPLPKVAILLLIITFYVLLGTFMESLSMMVTTLPVMFPVITALGYDPIWFGVLMVMFMEIGAISPPTGIPLFIMHSIRTDGGPLNDVFIGVLPFIVCYLIGVLFLVAIPELATWLPSVLMPRVAGP